MQMSKDFTQNLAPVQADIGFLMKFRLVDRQAVAQNTLTSSGWR